MLGTGQNLPYWRYHRKNTINTWRILEMGVNIASLILGITSPGALVSLYIPEAGIEHAAPGINLAGNVHGPAITLQDEAQLRYFSTLFRRPPAISRDGRTEERIEACIKYPAGTTDLFWALTALNILDTEGLSLLFVDENARQFVEARAARLRGVGLLAHIDPEAVGFSMRYQLPMANLAIYVSILRSILTVAPEIFPGGVRAAAVRRVPISSTADVAMLSQVSTKVSGKSRIALALELMSRTHQKRRIQTIC
jgi:hypothetical protein